MDNSQHLKPQRRTNMKKLIAILTVALAIPTMSFAEEQYPKEICKTMYDTIGVFLAIADKAWKSQDEEKALLYSTAAANYATVYELTCKR